MAGGTSTAALASLYKSLVLPVIEYGLPAWTPYTQTAISKTIEKIQRRASRICLRQRRGEMDYKDRLRTLGWTSLENRRQKHTITFVIKCLFGLVDCQSVVKINKINARHLDTLIFQHHFARTRALKNTPTHVFPRIWSNLPSYIKDSLILDSLASFNRTLSSYLQEL